MKTLARINQRSMAAVYRLAEGSAVRVRIGFAILTLT